MHDLPADLAVRMQPLDDLPRRDAHLLFDVRYTGAERGEPDLAGLTNALGAWGGRVSFVHGGIDRIQGRAQGRLVISAQIGAGADPRKDGAFRAQLAALVDGAPALCESRRGIGLCLTCGLPNWPVRSATRC